MQGINLATVEGDGADALRKWYKGPTLVDLLGQFTFSISSRNEVMVVSRRIGTTYSRYRSTVKDPDIKRL